MAERRVASTRKRWARRAQLLPLFCTVAQTGQVLDVHHRPGNVHDSNGADAFIDHCMSHVRSCLPSAKVETRIDSAFFNEAIAERLHGSGVEFTLSVPFERFAALKGLVEGRRRWCRMATGLDYFETRWKPKSWNARYRFIRRNSSANKRTVSRLLELLDTIDQIIERQPLSEAHPVYDRMNFVLAVHAAARAFHEAWGAWLGREAKPGFAKVHWARIKALSRRLATMGQDEYGPLKPVSDLRRESVEWLYISIQNPVRWEGSDPPEEEKQNKYDAFVDNLSPRLLDLSIRRVWRERNSEWQDAYYKSGRGSTFVRARIIDKDIHEPAAPVPDMTPSPNRNEFLQSSCRDRSCGTRYWSTDFIAGAVREAIGGQATSAGARCPIRIVYRRGAARHAACS